MCGVVSLQMTVETCKVANETQKSTRRILPRFSIFKNISTIPRHFQYIEISLWIIEKF